MYPPKGALPFDLHVLSTPPAFVLSQDQTLQFKPSGIDVANTSIPLFGYGAIPPKRNSHRNDGINSSLSCQIEYIQYSKDCTLFSFQRPTEVPVGLFGARETKGTAGAKHQLCLTFGGRGNLRDRWGWVKAFSSVDRE